MIEKNYYHFNPGNNSDDFILSQNAIISKDITKYLRSFQLSAVKFLYKNFEAHKACILNDESGLGKTVSIAVFLNVILANNHEKRKCLIICKNEDRIINWKFHLDILTDLSYKVVHNDNEIDDHIVCLTKWESLRSSASLSNYKFDCIIVDNRENLMANKICLAYLLRNYENKISLVISNLDITIDLKEFHSTLRLCGRLDPKYKDFKIFEDKFELPMVQGPSSDNNKLLESYFLRREKILNYCKEFCLRRFRHQYESELPLVQSNVYRLNVKKWQDAPMIAKIKPVQLNIFPIAHGISSIDRDTEELHNSFLNKRSYEHNGNDLLSSFFSRREEDEFNNEICRITTTITDNAVEQSTEVMSPLVFIPDDSEDLTNQSGGKLDEMVSSTTKDESEVRIIHPTPIHIYKKSSETLPKVNKRKINDIKIDNNESGSEPEISLTRSFSRNRKGKNSKPRYQDLMISRISTRGQDRVTRSQAHKNKYLTLSIENTIEKGKREIDEISKRKKKSPKSKESENKLEGNPPNDSKKNTNDADNTVSTSDNIINSNDSSFTFIFNQSFEPVLSSTDSTIEVYKPKKRKKIHENNANLSGLSLLDVQQSEAVHVIESTPELIVLSSSTDSSNHTYKNQYVKPFKKNSNESKITKQNDELISPDIFGSTFDESLNIICSQKGKHTTKPNVGTFFGQEKNQKDSSKKNKGQITYEITDLMEKNIRNRTNIPQNNKITKYLRTDFVLDSDKEVSSSSQSIQSSPLLVYPKTPRKKRMSKSLKFTNDLHGVSTTKGSPHSRTTSSTTTPTKTPTALTKWLLKSNSNGEELSSHKNNNRNEATRTPCFRETRSSSVKMRRKLDMS